MLHSLNDFNGQEGTRLKPRNKNSFWVSNLDAEAQGLKAFSGTYSGATAGSIWDAGTAGSNLTTYTTTYPLLPSPCKGLLLKEENYLKKQNSSCFTGHDKC